jgi:hypothetical protein
MITLTPSAGAAGTIFELRSDPHTIAGPGETCLVCGDPLSLGEVYLFVAWDGEAGVAHEDCAELEAAAVAAEEPGNGSTASAAGLDCTVAAVRDESAS